MKKIFLFLTIVFVPCQAFAQDYSLGIFQYFIEKTDDKYPSSNQPLFKPYSSNRLVFDVNFDDNYQTTDQRREHYNASARARFFSSLNFSKNFAINYELRLDQFNNALENDRRNSSPNGGGDRFFEDQGIYIRELNMSYSAKKYTLLAGKYSLDFGTAWDWNRGIWTYEIANSYQQSEKIGIGGIYRLGDIKKTGLYNFSFNSFVNDRKYLDNSILNKRDSDSKSAAIPGDENLPQSYNAAIDINFDFGEREKLSYHFSYLNLAVNGRATAVDQGKLDDQKGSALGMNYKYPVGENVDLNALIEYVDMKNVGGDSDVGQKYLTANVIGKFYQNWVTTLGYAERRTIEVVNPGLDQNLSEISFGYEFDKNSLFDKLLVQIGYKNERNNHKTSLETNNDYGVLLRYVKKF